MDEKQVITGGYMLLVFDRIFDKMNNVDKRKLLESTIAEVYLHPEKTW